MFRLERLRRLRRRRRGSIGLLLSLGSAVLWLLNQWSLLDFLVDKVDQRQLRGLVTLLVDGRVVFAAGIALVLMALWTDESRIGAPAPTGRVPEGRPEPPRLSQLPPPLVGPFTSRFAVTDADLATVLDLRRKFFAGAVIVPDAVYRTCWAKNPRTMKIVFDPDDRPVGYWAVIPVGAAAYAAFVRGQSSHEQMMTSVIRWEAVDPDHAYLYVVGAVVPVGAGTGDDWARKRKAGCVTNDLYNFGRVMLDCFEIEGICGYPTKDEGVGVFDRAKFVRTDVKVGGDDNQPVYVITPKELGALQRQLTAKRRGTEKVVWKAADKRQFLELVPRKTARDGDAPAKSRSGKRTV